MDYERIRSFILSYCKDDQGILGRIYEKARQDEVPIIRKEMRDFLRIMLEISRPRNILEIGTAVGYSTLIIADKLLEIYNMDLADSKVLWHIDTYELDEKRVSEAASNIQKYMESVEQTSLRPDGGEYISIHQGDAASLLSKIDNKIYDLVFIDAAKAQYMNYMQEAIRLSHSGTIIITDNILTDGEVLESHFLVEKRDRTIHDRMREYLYNIKNDERLDTAILSIADGVAVSIVR
ncbi:MAG: O-methyltransferase [Eubacterium sp.]|nr:O-methyltransferase [Eubacterium sp.]